jgi:hypothetical protein
MSSTHRHTPPGQHEHEFEPQYGLPERLPSGERILWQGSPDLPSIAVNAFHLRKLAAYFALLVALGAAMRWQDGATASQVLSGAVWPLALSVSALACIAVLAWLTARTTVYTLTDRRVVMRIGIVLTLTFNLPLARIAAAALRDDAAGCGDIVLTLGGDDRIAYAHLWPHARPWCLTRPQPMLRSVPDAARVAGLLSHAWSAAHGVPALAATPAPHVPGSPRLPTDLHPGLQASPT